MADKKDAEPDGSGTQAPQKTTMSTTDGPPPEFDDFGLPIRRYPTPQIAATDNNEQSERPDETEERAQIPSASSAPGQKGGQDAPSEGPETHQPSPKADSDGDVEEFKDAQSEPTSRTSAPVSPNVETVSDCATPKPQHTLKEKQDESAGAPENKTPIQESAQTQSTETQSQNTKSGESSAMPVSDTTKQAGKSASEEATSSRKTGHNREASKASTVNGLGISEFSHQQASTQHEAEGDEENDDWQEMPSYAPYDMYDDDNRIIAREHIDEEDDSYAGLGGAGKGYTRVIMDEDVESATSMDENTQYLFKESHGTSLAQTGDEDARDAMSQMQATKDLLTEGQRIAYVGVVRLEISKLVKECEAIEITKKTKKEIKTAAEATMMWGQKMMLRLYAHMEITEAEQVMIEQLADHGVQPGDLTPALLTNARVQNPMAEEKKSPAETSKSASPTPNPEDEAPAEAPPPYSEKPEDEEVPELQSPSQVPTTDKIDIDLRWTVLCDLFLVLIADSVYDARSRVLLERVGGSLDISWLDICRFEKRVTDALEMQQAAEKENWNEEEHLEHRRKMAKTRRYVLMGLATVGGGLVIGLSAGLLAPVIGAGLAAGFTTIGVTGTSSFLAGAGGAAIITSSAAASGGFIGIKAANRRTGAVKTFEYRPLHNNKRVNLIVTVSGWLTGKVDDVRLPFSTVDPIMGDVYSVLWEPEMLRSMGDTINILATEALTQGLQQLLGSTILVGLMAALQLPIVLTKLSYLIDNPWAVSLDRAISAGQILADSLVERNLGTRPITLVGYSLGSRVIFSCLRELAKKGAYGLVQNVYLFGSPIVVKKEEYLRARTVVSGRFVNGYNRNDWILGYLFRLTNGGIRRIAGLAPIEDCPWIENMDVTELVPGHMEYRTAMPMLLMKCGWSVESEEFTEIEDPDPEDHKGRQRELINEIEEARKELEREGKAGKQSKFGIFSRRKKAERQEWEVYEDSKGKEDQQTEEKPSNNYGVLFDVDAMRAELAKEAKDGNLEELQIKELQSTLPPMQLEELQIREIQSTLPPMKLDLASTSSLPSPATSNGMARTGSAPERPRAVTVPGLAADDSPFATSAHNRAEELADDEIQMTFDTQFTQPSSALSSRDEAETMNRPGMRSSQTLPKMTLSDPWGDADDEDFGKEKEITMTFA